MSAAISPVDSSTICTYVSPVRAAVFEDTPPALMSRWWLHVNRGVHELAMLEQCSSLDIQTHVPNNGKNPTKCGRRYGREPVLPQLQQKMQI